MELKLGGVLLMFGSILLMFAMPWLDFSRVRSARFRPIYKQAFWVFVINAVILGWIGAQPAEGMYLVIGRIATAYYFVHLLVLVPLISLFERPLPLPESISNSVLGGSAVPKGAFAAPEKQ